MRRLLLITVGVVAAGGLAAAPAIAGLTHNPSFSHQIPIPVPSQAHPPQFVDDQPSDPASPTSMQRSRSAEPGDDRSARATSTEPGDDRGGRDGRGSSGGSSGSDDGGDRADTADSADRADRGGHGRHGDG